MKDTHILQDTKEWMETAIPFPAVKNIHTQLGVHFEEIAEMLECITPYDKDTAVMIVDLRQSLIDFSDHLKASKRAVILLEEDRQDYLDSLCDQIVTAVGCAHNSKLDIIGAMKEVNRSNYSKFDENGKPIFNQDRKIIKGPNYVKADLAPYI